MVSFRHPGVNGQRSIRSSGDRLMSVCVLHRTCRHAFDLAQSHPCFMIFFTNLSRTVFTFTAKACANPAQHRPED
jgi:hypothetical protein